MALENLIESWKTRRENKAKGREILDFIQSSDEYENSFPHKQKFNPKNIDPFMQEYFKMVRRLLSVPADSLMDAVAVGDEDNIKKYEDSFKRIYETDFPYVDETKKLSLAKYTLKDLLSEKGYEKVDQDITVEKEEYEESWEFTGEKEFFYLTHESKPLICGDGQATIVTKEFHHRTEYLELDQELSQEFFQHLPVSIDVLPEIEPEKTQTYVDKVESSKKTISDYRCCTEKDGKYV